MRRELSEVAAQRGLEWSFGVVRDLPSSAALAEIEADILVLEATPRPFSGSWRPRSSWDPAAKEYTRTTLIRRQKATGPGTILVLLSGPADREKTLASSLLMAGPGDEIMVLVSGGSLDDIASVKEVAERLAPPHQRNIRLEAAPADEALLFQQVDRLKPVLLVVDSGGAGGPDVRDLLANTQCDVLLVR